MQALVIGSRSKLSKNFKVIYINSVDDFEEAKKKLDINLPCLLYTSEYIRLEDPEDIWKFHLNNNFSVVKVLSGNKEEICSFHPKHTFYSPYRGFYFTGMPFTIANKAMILELPETKLASIITCASNDDKYERILLPSLHKANNFLLTNGLDLFETVCVKGTDFKTIGDAYNYGISQAKSKIKIFIHDDIDMLHPSWIIKILLGFSDPEVGLMGLVGSTNPSYTDHWWMKGVKYVYGKQIVGVGDKKQLWHWNENDIPHEGKFDLKILDGCFFATNRNVKFKVPDTKFFITPYEHDISSQILDMNLRIGVIKHLTWHYAYPKEDKSKIGNKEEWSELLSNFNQG